MASGQLACPSNGIVGRQTKAKVDTVVAEGSSEKTEMRSHSSSSENVGQPNPTCSPKYSITVKPSRPQSNTDNSTVKTKISIVREAILKFSEVADTITISDKTQPPPPPPPSVNDSATPVVKIPVVQAQNKTQPKPQLKPKNQTSNIGGANRRLRGGALKML